MSRKPPPQVPAVVFGDLEADLWGLLIGAEDPLIAVAGLSGPAPSLTPAHVERDSNEGALTVVAPGLALSVTPAGEPTTTTESAGRMRLVSVSGAAGFDGSERELTVGGLAIDNLFSHDTGSVRLFAGWFPGDRTLGLLASRAADAKGHDRDEIEVTGSGEQEAVVLDPRLSTTYGDQEAPLRIGIELWLADAPDAEENRSRRIAAMATGSRVSAPEPLPELSGHALRCISRAEPGAGVYLVARAS